MKTTNYFKSLSEIVTNLPYITVSDPKMKWAELNDMRSLERIWVRPSLNEIFDLQWSPDSAYIIIGALDAKAEIIRISSRDSLVIPGHTSYVQGVAWDPLNAMVATQSSDRSCKIHMIKYKDGVMVKLAPRGHLVAKMHNGYRNQSQNLTAADFGMEAADGSAPVPDGSAKSKGASGINLFADSNVPSFFR